MNELCIPSAARESPSDCGSEDRKRRKIEGKERGKRGEREASLVMESPSDCGSARSELSA